MIIESGIIRIIPGKEKDFEAGFALSRKAIEAAEGCHKIEMRRGVENPSEYLLLVWWDSVDDHMVGFRNSPGFAEWRKHIGPFFAEPPKVLHYEEAL